MTFNIHELRGHGGKWIKGGATLNVGLHVGDPAKGGRVMSEQEVHAVIKKFGGEIVRHSKVDSTSEPTSVVSLKRGLSPEHLHALSVALHQDAIAQRRDDGTGDLAGPKAAEWGGKYDPEQFIMHNGSTAAVRDAALARQKKIAQQTVNLSTPYVYDDIELSNEGEGVAFWKQILPMKAVEYTAQDGTRQVANFDEQYLTDLATNMAVDTVGFLLADKSNAHTMDPDRWRGEVAKFEVRKDVENPGLYGKIVFPNRAAAAAVLANPKLGVSARIRENIHRSDGSNINRGIIHVLGTLDPQVSGMSPWEQTDLSNESDVVLDLTNERFVEMATKKNLSDFNEADIDAMTDDELDAFLAEYVPDFDASLVEDEVEAPEAKTEVVEKELVGAGADMSNVQKDIDLANARAEDALSQARAATAKLAAAEWKAERESLANAGVPPHMLDLAAPVMSHAGGMVIDLSNEGGENIDATMIVRGLLEAAKGTIDMSNEQGHGATFTAGDGADPDAEILSIWASQS